MSAPITTGRSRAGALPVLLFAGAIVTAVIGVADPVTGRLPDGVLILSAALAGAMGIISAFRGMRGPTTLVPSASVHPSAFSPPAAPATQVSAVWLGMTMVFAVLTLMFAPLALVMMFTGLMAFRRRKLAAGVALALALVVMATLALATAVGLLDNEPAVVDYYQYCLGQGYSAAVCADY